MMRSSVLLFAVFALVSAAEPPPAPPPVVTIPEADRATADALLAGTLDGRELAPPAATTIGGMTHQGAPAFVGWFRSADADHVSATWTTTQGMHQRSVLHIKPSYLVVFDHVYATGNRSLSRDIRLPGVPTIAEATATVTGTPAWLAHLADGTGWDAGANGLRSTSDGPAPFSRSLVLAVAADGRLPTVTAIKAGNPLVRKLKLAFTDGHADTLALAWESRPLHLPDPLTGKNVEHHGRAVCVRTTPGAAPRVINVP